LKTCVSTQKHAILDITNKFISVVLSKSVHMLTRISKLMGMGMGMQIPNFLNRIQKWN